MKFHKDKDISSLSKSELIVLVYKQADQIDSLKARIVELEDKFHKKEALTQSQTLPSWIKPSVKRIKKKKRKKRACSYTRMKDAPTQIVDHAYETCPSCKGALGKPSVCYNRQIIDIPITPAVVTEHVIYKRYCFSCKKRVFPKPNLSSYVVGKNRIGVNLMALIATMRVEERMPIKMIQRHLKTFYHLHLSTGEITQITHKTALWGVSKYKKIKQDILSSHVIYADETGGRENGKNGYWWNFSNKTHQLLLYRHSRGSKVVEEVVGEEGEKFEGVMVSDFYAAYNTYTGFHQRCWVHFLRDVSDLTKEYPNDKLLKTWSKDIKKLYRKAQQYTRSPVKTPAGMQEQIRIQQEAKYKQRLKNICEPYLTKDTVFTTLNARLIKYLPELFTFVRFPNILPENNTAERALRHLVVSRKISGGTRSAKGSQTKAILASLFGTWRLQGLNPFEQTRQLLLNTACQEV